MSIQEVSQENLSKSDYATPSFTARLEARPDLGDYLTDFQILSGSKPPNPVLPPVSFHNQSKTPPGSFRDQLQKSTYEAQIEKLGKYNNFKSLLDAHIIEHKLQLDIAQRGNVSKRPDDLIEFNSKLLEEIKELKEEFLTLSTNESLKEKAMDSVNTAIHFNNELIDSANFQQSEFCKSASKLKDLDLEALALYNEISEKERALFRLEENILAEAKKNQERFKVLEELKLEMSEKEKKHLSNKMESLSIEESKLGTTSEKIKLKKRHIITLQHLISGLALSSSAEWHLDEELQEAMLDPCFPSDI